MKVHEILDEAISLTSEVGNVRKLAIAGIRDGLTQIAKLITTNIKDLFPNQEISADWVTKKVENWFKHRPFIEDAIKVRLWTAFKDRGLHTIKFGNIGSSRGQVSGRTIVMSETYMKRLLPLILKDIEYQLMDGLEDSKDYDGIMSVLSNYVPSRQVWDLIVDMSETIIHELVHVTQHTRQSHRDTTEYRSYLTKDKEVFNRAVTQLNDKVAHIIYRASPQEIAAHAHNMAIHLIDLASETPIDEMRTTREVQGAINNLDEVIKLSKNYNISDTFRNYKGFNQPDNPRFYQVYKRFMKRVYQEVMRYRQQLQNRLDQL